MEKIVCRGCGGQMPNKNLPASEVYNASGECNELFNELSGYTLSMTNTNFIHQLAGDAYGAQHAGAPTKNIRMAFALIGLCLAIQYNYTGRQVQLVHMKIPKQNWETLEPPKEKASTTVADVLNANSEIERILLINQWVNSVWKIWSQHHEWVRQKAFTYL